jgi:hypothetical protein
MTAARSGWLGCSWSQLSYARRSVVVLGGGEHVGVEHLGEHGVARVHEPLLASAARRAAVA